MRGAGTNWITEKGARHATGSCRAVSISASRGCPRHRPRVGIRRGRLFRPIREIVELRDAVRLRPDADFPRILERRVVPLEGLLAVECDREMTCLELDA